jgi:hypothetical protein
MKKSTSTTPLRSFTLLSMIVTIIFAITLLLQWMSCGGEEDTSLVTGNCEFSRIDLTLDQNSITLGKGEQQDIEVLAVVSCNCEDYLNYIEFYKVPDADYSNVNFDWAGSFDGSDNRATGYITITVSGTAPPGTYSVEIEVEATGGTESEDIITGYTTLEVIVSSGDFTVDVPQFFGVAQGSSTEVTASVARTNGHTADIDLSVNNLPSNITYTFSPNPVTLDDNSSQLIISAGVNAIPNDNYLLEVIGNDGNMIKHDIFHFSVFEPFFLTLSTDTIDIQQGQSALVNVYMNRSGGYSYSIDLSAQGDIVGQGDGFVEITFDPNPVESISSTATIIAGNTIEPGSYPVTFKGTVDETNKYVTLNLVVSE